MLKNEIYDIEIIYDDNQSEFIDEFITILGNNYSVCKFIFNKYKKDVKRITFITDRKFDDDVLVLEMGYNLFIDLLKDFISKIPSLFKNSNLSTIYYKTLDEQEYKPESYDYFIASEYYSRNGGTIEDYINYAFYRKDHSKIKKWFKDENRYFLINTLLINHADRVKQDSEFNQNLEKILPLLYEDFFSEMELGECIPLFESRSEKNSERIDLSDLEKIFIEFLYHINAPKDWIETYWYLKKNNLIIIDDKNGNNKWFIDTDGVAKIKLDPCNSPISFFCSFVHEFVHYISMKNNNGETKKILTLEFPTIFFEELAYYYITLRPSYEGKSHDYILKRYVTNSHVAFTITDICSEILSFIKEGIIIKEDKLKHAKKVLGEADSINDNLNYFDLYIISKLNECGKDKIDDETLGAIIDDYYDKLTHKIINLPPDIIFSVKYIIGTKLKDAVLELDDIEITLKKVFMITNNIDDYSLNDIQKLFNVQIFMEPGRRLS